MSNYGSPAGLTTYATDRGVELSGDPSVLLTRAHDYLESLDYIGQKTDPGQVNEWPRKKARVDGQELDDSVVPAGIVNAEYAVAVAIEQGWDPLAVTERTVESESLDIISVDYVAGSSSIGSAPAVTAALRKYLRGGVNPIGGSFEVVR